MGDYSDQLAGDVCDILLGQLPLLSPGGRNANRRLELRHPKLRPEILHRITLPELTQALLPQALAALHGSILQLRLVLQHSDDLWHDLPHHFVDILLAQRARGLSVSGISDCRVRLLCLSQDLRQRWHQLPYHLAHVLLRKLALLLAAPLRLLLLAPTLMLPAPSGVVSKGSEGRLPAILAVLLAIGCLP